MKRDTRLLNKESFDDPTEFLEAGSVQEADMLAEWDRGELVDSIQALDKKCWQLEKKNIKLEEIKWMYEDLCR